MTKREAAIVTAYTGILIGEFSDFHEYVEELLDRPVFTHQFGDKDFNTYLKDKCKADFLSINVQ